MTEPILITGCARSGTSMIAGIVNNCGAFGGRLSGATRYNQKGMFEHAVIRNNIVKPFFREIGADAMGQYPLPDIDKCRQLAPTRKDSWRKTVLTALRNDGYREGIWFYKGAKMCLMWPVWMAAFPEAKWIIVRRKDVDIIASCIHTGFMRAYKNAQGWQSWIDQHKKRFAEMKTAGANIREVWPEDLVDGDLTIAEQLIEWCGLEWQRQKVVEFITPKLWKTNMFVGSTNSTTTNASGEQKEARINK